jgi:hypothetical protein
MADPLPEIKHVVVLMLENRSFDHMLGGLPGVDGASPAWTNNDGQQIYAQTPIENSEQDDARTVDPDPKHETPNVLRQIQNNNGGYRGRAEKNAARLSEQLHPGGEMGGLADRGVVHVQVAADGPHHDLAGVQADPDLDADPVRAPGLVGIAPHRLLHAEGGVAGSHGMVLVSQRRAEERHDSVAHDLVDGALVAMHRLHHVLENGIKQLARLLGIAVGEELHRSLEVREEDRDLLALALKGAL